jgi:glycosyltransferase involved in cell wall biosynthesis
MPAVRISLIISTYENPQVLDKALAGVSQQSEPPHEVLIADDGSGQATRQLIESWKGRLPLRHVWHEDHGFRKTIILNKAVAAATGDYIVFTDSDCVPHRHFVRDHGEMAEAGFWVQGRRCFVREQFVKEFAAGQSPIWWWCLRGRITGLAKAFRLPFPVVRRDQAQRGIIGCNLAAWRADLLAVNGFDEDYTGWGIGEDSDLGTRLYHLGRQRKFVYGRAILCHLNHPQLPRDHVAASLQRLAETIAAKKIRCERGIDQYLGDDTPRDFARSEAAKTGHVNPPRK